MSDIQLFQFSGGQGAKQPLRASPERQVTNQTVHIQLEQPSQLPHRQDTPSTQRGHRTDRETRRRHDGENHRHVHANFAPVHLELHPQRAKHRLPGGLLQHCHRVHQRGLGVLPVHGVLDLLPLEVLPCQKQQ